MLRKCTVIFTVIFVVQSATLQRRNIPVEIRYERLDHDISSNLAEKVQLSPSQLKENQLRLEQLTNTEEHDEKEKDHSHLNKNLDEKVQLSPEELIQAPKHIPIHHAIQANLDTNELEKLGELRNEPLLKSETPNKATFIQQAQDIVEKGLENLRNNFVPKENEQAPSKDLWDKLEQDISDFFSQEKNKLGSRQDQGSNQQNIFQNFANGFQQLTNNFIQQFQGQAQNGTSGDEGTASQQGPIQGFIGYFTGGVQNIVSNIQNIGQGAQAAPGNSTVLGDTGSSQPPTNIIGSFVNGVQQFFQGPQQGINQVLSGNNTQGDTGSGNPPGSQQGFFAGAISQINQVVSNIRPTSQAPPAASQGDEGTTGSTQTGPIQQVFQQFGNLGTAFNQFIQGGTQKPPGSEDESSSPPSNQNFIQAIGQNIGNAFQNIQNQFRPPSGGIPQPPATNGESSNPIIGQVSNIGSQLQQVAGSNPIQNLIPGSTDNASKNPAEDTPSTENAELSTQFSDNQESKTSTPEKKEDITAME